MDKVLYEKRGGTRCQSLNYGPGNKMLGIGGAAVSRRVGVVQSKADSEPSIQKAIEK
jgi:hypothetical protein